MSAAPSRLASVIVRASSFFRLLQRGWRSKYRPRPPRRPFWTGAAADDGLHCLRGRSHRDVSSREISQRALRFDPALVLLLARGRFPGHEVVEGLAASSHGERKNGCVVKKTERWKRVGNYIERIHDVDDGRNDHDQRAFGNIAIVGLRVGPN